MTFLDYIRASGQFLFLAISDLLMDALGLIVVAVAIPFRQPGVSIDDGRPILKLPKWAWLWSNDFDGLLGDSRLWWKANTPFGLPYDSFIPMYTWAALRNPANNMRMLSLWNAPIIGSVITFRGSPIVGEHPGESGSQFVKLVTSDGKTRYGFYLMHQWSPTHALVIRLGFKISPDEIGTQSLPKGETTRFNPYKSIV